MNIKILHDTFAMTLKFPSRAVTLQYQHTYRFESGVKCQRGYFFKKISSGATRDSMSFIGFRIYCERFRRAVSWWLIVKSRDFVVVIWNQSNRYTTQEKNKKVGAMNFQLQIVKLLLCSLLVVSTLAMKDGATGIAFDSSSKGLPIFGVGVRRKGPIK